MNGKLANIAIGFLCGVIATLIGVELYLVSFTHFEFFRDFEFIKNTGMLGKITAIGSLLNLALFTFFINKRYDFLSRGCILAVIIITFITQII